MALSRWFKLKIQTFLFVKGVVTRMTFGSRGVLIDGDKVLLVRHTYMPGWQFPGGGVDPGETAEEGFLREVREETGYRVLGQTALFGLYHNVQATNRDHVAFFVSHEFEIAHAFKPSWEIAEMGWFDRKALPEEVPESTRQRIAEIFDGAARRPTW